MVINPINNLSLAQVPGEMTRIAAPRALPTNPFEDILSRAVDSLNGVSQTESAANELINRYIEGTAELSDVMLATSKMSIAVQLAVTVITSAVASFKELTQQIQI
jgi:flagellar hook-basal body complex protein FliE